MNFSWKTLNYIGNILAPLGDTKPHSLKLIHLGNISNFLLFFVLSKLFLIAMILQYDNCLNLMLPSASFAWFFLMDFRWLVTKLLLLLLLLLLITCYCVVITWNLNKERGVVNLGFFENDSLKIKFIHSKIRKVWERSAVT
jgi:hypothetical protein